MTDVSTTEQLNTSIIDVKFTIGDMLKAYSAGMDRGADLAEEVLLQRDKLIKADDFITFVRKTYI